MSFFSSFSSVLNPYNWFANNPNPVPAPIQDPIEAFNEEFEFINAPDVDDNDDFEFINPADVNEIQVPIEVGLDHLERKKIAGFDRAKILEMCNFSKISYGNSEEKLHNNGYKSVSDYEKEGYTVIPFSNSYEKAGHVFLKGREVIIAYHGTQSFNNVLTDLHANLVTSHFLPEGGRIHCGFYRAFKDSWSNVAKIIKNHARTTGIPIHELNYTFTGHSMGGAIAKIGALCVTKSLNANNVQVATFGDPRVFDLLASQIYNKRLGNSSVRVTQFRRDPVTALCPGSLGYAHVGAQLRVDPHSGTGVHKLDGYFNVLKNMTEDQFVANNSASLFYYPSKTCQYINHYTLGNIQHYSRSIYQGIFGQKDWSREPFSEPENANVLGLS